MKGHLENPRKRNATCISPRIQNEIVDIIGKCIIQKLILEEIKKTKLFSVMADEVTSQKKLAMPYVLDLWMKKMHERNSFTFPLLCVLQARVAIYMYIYIYKYAVIRRALS